MSPLATPFRSVRLAIAWKDGETLDDLVSSKQA